MLKRLFDVVFSLLSLILLAPLFALTAIFIKFDSSGPIFFRQARVGRHEKIFRIHKFRTMIKEKNDNDLLVTVADDARITRLGMVLRKYKIDELPQLIDVFLGHMSLVGPRPEVPSFVEYYPSDMRKLIFSIRPGITDLASINFINESSILDASKAPIDTYVKLILPVKLNYYENYIRHRTFFLDLYIIFLTVKKIFVRSKPVVSH